MKKTILWGTALALAAGVAGCGGNGLEAGVPKNAQGGTVTVMPPVGTDIKAIKKLGGKAPGTSGPSHRR